MSAESVHAATRGMCPACRAIVEAAVVLDGDRVLLRSVCPDHGVHRALVADDAAWYLRSLAYVRPGSAPRSRAVAERDRCPDACGLCPDHQQHTCVPVLEITAACDLACPVCLVAGSPVPELSRPDVRSILDALLEREGALPLLTLSGGEPTSHPDFLGILDEVCRGEVGVVSVSTNGVRLAADERLLDEVAARGAVISLQLDGVRAATYAALRGRADLAEVKARLLERALARGVRVSLTMTVARGVNEDEIPSVLGLLLDNAGIVSLMMQPESLAHREAGEDRVTISEVVRRLAAGSRGLLEERHFTPLPCSHPSCFALTYLLRTDGGRLVPLSGLLDPDPYLDLIANQALLGAAEGSASTIRDALTALWSSSGAVPARDDVLATARRLLRELGTGRADLLAAGLSAVKSIFIHHFMDAGTFDLSRAIKCCTHVPQGDGRLIPECMRNNRPAALACGSRRATR